MRTEYTWVELEECGSTNDEAWKYLKQSQNPVLIISKEQIAGRGRQGRKWESASGNVFASAGFQIEAEQTAFLSWIPLVAGVTAANALKKSLEVAEKPRLSGLRLKWPNDLYFEEKKIGGLLCESKIRGEMVSAVVVGLGLNILHSPHLEHQKTGSVFEDLVPESKVNILSAVRLVFVFEWMRLLSHELNALGSDSVKQIRIQWEAWACLKNYAELTIHNSQGERIHVRAQGLDDSGKLVVQTSQGTQLLLDQVDSF